jgi:hypothetical protein
MQSDEDGFLDRRCPAEHCGSEFKVLEDHWREKVPNERAWCPFCGSQESPQEFNTAEQTEHIKRTAHAFIGQALHRGMKESATDFNRRQPRNSFLSIRLDVRSPAPSRPLPPAAAAVMRTEFSCPSCACRYRVVGSGFFCPACSHCSADQTFDQSIGRVRKCVEVFAALAPTLGPDDAAMLSTQLLEGGVSDLVTAFQHLAEVLFPRLSGSATVRLRRNQFQNLGEGSTAWATAGGRAYSAIMTTGELAEMERLFQQRHLLEHREGFVDQSYLDRTGDTTYSVGARLIVREASIKRLADFVEKLARGLRADVAPPD